MWAVPCEVPLAPAQLRLARCCYQCGPVITELCSSCCSRIAPAPFFSRLSLAQSQNHTTDSHPFYAHQHTHNVSCEQTPGRWSP